MLIIFVLVVLSLILAFYTSWREDLVAKTILRSETDNQLYKAILLANNMKVLLISDPNTETAAASLEIGVGSYHDPKYLPGLAHLMEHMLFKGFSSEENNFANLISFNGGSYDAYTQDESTNFHFEVTHNMLESALDQFSKYFTDLLIKPEKIEQEVNYIDKEFSKALDNINWQIEFLLRQMSNPASLYSRFSLGNSQSILENTKKQNIDLDSELSDFYASLYSANLMSLVVKGRQSLEILEDWVKNKFTFVKDNKLILPSFARTSKAFSLDKLGKIVWLKNK